MDREGGVKKRVRRHLGSEFWVVGRQQIPARFKVPSGGTWRAISAWGVGSSRLR